MSKAFQCDRCNKCFSPKNMNPNDFFVTFKEFYEQTVMDYEENKVSIRIEDWHLCPSCSENFYSFLNLTRKQITCNQLGDVAKNSTP